MGRWSKRESGTTSYADLSDKESVEVCVGKAVEYALEQGCDFIEVYQGGRRIATYQFDGTKFK